MSPRRIIGSEALDALKPLAAPLAAQAARPRGPFLRWLTFLAAVWLPSQPTFRRN